MAFYIETHLDMYELAAEYPLLTLFNNKLCIIISLRLIDSSSIVP